jgi:hypothetical protein
MQQLHFLLTVIQKALSFISEESLQSLMNTIHSLTYHDKLSRSDVLMMTPLERLIELSLLKKSLEALTEPAEDLELIDVM